MATPWLVVAADMGAAIVVIFNGLRLPRSAAPDERTRRDEEPDAPFVCFW